MFLLPEHPVFGASPDGITKEHIIKIKCPSSIETMLHYIKNGQIINKFNAQMQMFLAHKQVGLFCVADPDFEKNSNVNIVTVGFDQGILKEIINDALENWTNFIFPKLYDSAI